MLVRQWTFADSRWPTIPDRQRSAQHILLFCFPAALDSITLRIMYIVRRLQTGTHAPVYIFLGPIGPGVMIGIKPPLKQNNRNKKKRKSGERRLYRAARVYISFGAQKKQNKMGCNSTTCIWSGHRQVQVLQSI
ncbi:unnamed protein product [Laminaria digitata]